MPRWSSEGNDAAILAQAINSKVVTEDLQSFKDFFDPEGAGPGAAIGEKYSYHTKKGQRNLKNNWVKLTKKIKHWTLNIPDPDTNKRKFVSTINQIGSIQTTNS